MGPIRALPMQERMTLANMTAEFGGQVGLVAPDEITVEYLRERGVEVGNISCWRTDDSAPLRAHHLFAAESLAPQVAAPDSPANTAPVAEFAAQAIDIAYIGACTGAKLEDLRMAARVLRGRKVASGVSLMVAPATARDQAQAAREGTLQAIIDAGAELLPNSCGACAGFGRRFGEDSRAISSTARNFKGRMGAASSRVWLGSPYTVAASALVGRIANAGEFLA